jgi:hypothetical protein
VVEQSVAFEREELVARIARCREGAGLVDIEHGIVEGAEQVGGQH